MPDTAAELARRLAANAEAVCRHYLSNGRRAGSYWRIGNVQNTPGRSLYVRLRGPNAGKGAAGKWTDAATGEHGDLLDLIQAAHGSYDIGDALEEARRFLGLSRGKSPCSAPAAPRDRASQFGDHRPLPSLPQAALRLWSMSRPVGGTLAEAYLAGRRLGRGAGGSPAALRYHPNCFYRAEEGSFEANRKAWPALIAAVTNPDGRITGVHRTWLNPSTGQKAPVSSPRRAMGHLLGYAVRFGRPDDVIVVGEGIETTLSLRPFLATMPLAACLSAGHLAAFVPSAGLRRLYIACDNDRAGRWATERLANRMSEAGIEVAVLSPQCGDFNDDLLQVGPQALANHVRGQLVPEDVERFWQAPDQTGIGWIRPYSRGDRGASPAGRAAPTAF